MHRLSLLQVDKVLMVILESTRIVIPDNSQKSVLKELHKAHSGISKTFPNCRSTLLMAGHEKLHLDVYVFLQNVHEAFAFTSWIQSNRNCTISSKITYEWPRSWSIWHTGQKVASFRLLWLCMALSAQENYNCVSSREFGKSFLGIWLPKFHQVRGPAPIPFRICRVL